MRNKTALCRVFVVLLLGGVAFLVANMLLLYSQVPSQQQQQCPKCDCEGGSVNSKRAVELLSSQPSQGESIVSKNVPQAATPSNRHDSLLRLLNKTRQQQQMVDRSEHQLAVIVPFRNRYEEMMEFVPHIHRFLERQNVKHKIWIINQADTHRCVHVCAVEGVLCIARDVFA